MKLYFNLKTIYYAIITACLFSTISCNKEEVTSDVNLQITSLLSVQNLRSTNQSLQLAQFDTGEKVGIYVGNTASTLPLEYTTGGSGALSPTTGLSPAFPVSGGLYVYSIYPFQSTVTLGSTPAFSVLADQSTDANFKASDLMWGVPATNPVAKTVNAVPITYKHLLSKININLTSGVGTPDLNGAVVRINGTRITTTYNPMTGVITAATGNAVPVTAFTAGSTAATQKGSAIVVPQTVYSGTDFIEVKLASGLTLAYVLGANLPLAGKTEYTYNVTVNYTSLDIASSIATWGVGGSVTDDVHEGLDPAPNCYVVKPSVGSVTIPLTNVNLFWGKWGDGAIAKGMGNQSIAPRMSDLNTDTGYTIYSGLLDGYSVFVIWSSYDYSSKPITFSNKSTAGFTVNGLTSEGNVVIGIQKNGLPPFIPQSPILWSWHLWVTSADLEANTVTLPSGLVAMDRNLGALSSASNDPKSTGLVYQWGRKDPFPNTTSTTASTEPTTYSPSGSTTTRATAPNGTLLLSVNNPFTFYTSGGDPFTNGYLSGTFGYNRWGGSESNIVPNPKKNKRSLYDPCPAGWRMPWGTEAWSGLSGNSWNNDIYHGFTYSGNFFPAAGIRDGATGALSRAMRGGYWNASYVSQYTVQFKLLAIYDWYYQQSWLGPGNAYSIRPVKE